VVLDPTVASEGRPSAGRRRRATPDPRDGPSEPTLGRAAHSRRVVEAGIRGVRADDLAADAASADATLADVADVLANHLDSTVAIDFFVVPTLTCRILFVFVVLAHDRRRILHVNVTQHPTSAWTRQQLREAFPNDPNARFLFHDRDTIFDAAFSRAAEAVGLTAVRTAPRSPWQNPYVERVIGSIRRECLDHVIVVNERHLRRVLRTYVAYYQRSRTHLALGKDAPAKGAVQPTGRIVVRPEVGGLHHRYERQAA